ncbi:uncharacterized protein LOC132900141 isoform X2 [Neoarius graeffei]|uniref:uncharacterized protein LOC132900141 isoform X2 n=1 Tax=Neoarius graeffei TaxID=443677 RepID=UPI00298C272D|nr:uncharacterized protein LOC132900141 isoform X2 [Neoarius graeffei]
MDSIECARRWKNLHDKFVRQRKAMMAKKSGDPGGERVPPFYIFMSWLEPHVKHRKTSSNFPSEAQSSQETDSSSGPPSPTRTLESLYASQPVPSTSAALSVRSTLLCPVPPASPTVTVSTARLPPASPAATESPARLTPASPAPSVRPAPQRVVARHCKRRRTEDSGLQLDIQAHLDRLVESRQMLQSSLVHDDCSSFATLCADLLSKIPEGRREEFTRNLLNQVYDEVARVQAEARAQA